MIIKTNFSWVQNIRGSNKKTTSENVPESLFVNLEQIFTQMVKQKKIRNDNFENIRALENHSLIDLFLISLLMLNKVKQIS